MSRVSDIHDALITLIGTTLPAYSRLPNAYVLEANPVIIFPKSYAVAFGGGINTQRFVGARATIERSFNVVLVGQVTATELDTSARVSLEKAIMEDVVSLVRAIEANPSLGGLAIKVVYVSDGGIEYVEGDQSNYFVVQCQFDAEYLESLA